MNTLQGAKPVRGTAVKPISLHPNQRSATLVARSYQGPPPPRRDGFWTGFALGGAIFGAAGFFFAPQISRAILNEQHKFKAPHWFEENKPPVTKQELEDKIDQLHAAINDVATQIGPDGETKHANNSSEAVESTVSSP